jgi:hypothetical protein
LTTRLSTTYSDLVLEIGTADCSEYSLATRSPAGETRQPLILPFASAETSTWQQRLEAMVGRGADQTRHLGVQPQTPEDNGLLPHQFGAALFNAVFTGNALSLFDTNRALARRDGSGLRLRLRILAPELATLPWELLYDPRQGEFLALSQQTPLVRTVETMQPLENLAVTPPLRILGMAVSPVDLQPLDMTHEQELLQGAVTPMGGQLELVWTAGESWRALQGSLQQGPWHIFHFVGHGVFDAGAAEGSLALADEQGRADLRSTQELARLLVDHPALRLIVLNACEGAQSGTLALYSSIAERLVLRGLPAVLAMQTAITDTAAVEFTRSFYGALANGLPVDAACTEARKAMSLAAPGSWEWATPVLFMRSPNGELWTRSTEAEGAMMESANVQPWWEQVANSIGKVDASNTTGDVIIVTVGAGAKNVAVGKNITQAVTEVLGPPTPDDKKLIEQQFTQITTAFQGLQSKLDPTKAQFAQFQLLLLQGELAKTGEAETPSDSTITKVGNWLLDNLPELGQALGSLFALPAVGRVIGKAGEVAVKWVLQRFGNK